MSVFDLPQQLQSLNFGAVDYRTLETLPYTVMPNGRIGVGSASGQTIFKFQDQTLWWSPSLSYFEVSLHLTDLSGNALPLSAGIGLCDNWTSTLFSKITYTVQSTDIERCQFPPQIDTCLTYSGCKKNWLDTFASSQGIGVPLMKRIQDASVNPSTATPTSSNYNTCVAQYRPPISIFNHVVVPPGPVQQFTFDWSPYAEQQIIESLTAKIAGVDYIVVVDSMKFYKACLMPNNQVALPPGGLLECSPCDCQQIPLNGGNQLSYNVPLRGTTNRLYVIVQDNNVTNNLAAGQNGLKPITSFASAWSNGASDLASTLSDLYIDFPELGVRYPPTSYPFSTKVGFERMYTDWAITTQGNSQGNEGSIPFGNNDITVGAEIIAPNATPSAVYNAGDKNNKDRAVLYTTAATALTSQTYNRTALYGWYGKYMIFSCPVIRPMGKPITTCTLKLQMTQPVTSVNIYVLFSYNQVLKLTNIGNNTYQYDLIQGM